MVCIGKGTADGLVAKQFPQLVVADDEKRVHGFAHGFKSLRGLLIPPASLKLERNGDDAHGQDAALLARLCDDRCGACARASAHAGSDKHHARVAPQQTSDFVKGFDGGIFAHLREGARTLATRQCGTKLDFARDWADVQSLRIGVADNEVHTSDALLKHGVDCVGSTAAYADDFDGRIRGLRNVELHGMLFADGRESGEVFGFKPILDALHEFLNANVGQAQFVVGGCVGFRGFGANAVIAFDHEAHTSGVRWDARVFRGVGNVLPGETEATIQACHELEELGHVFQLRAATGEHDAADELVAKTGAPDFVVHVLDDFGHPCFDDLRKRLQRNLLGLASGQSGNANDFVGLGFLGKGGAKLSLELFRLALHDLASLADVVADHISTKWNDRRVANDAILENGNVGGAATDVHQRHPGLFLFFRKHGSGRSKGFQNELIHFKSSLADALVDVLGCGHLACDDVEVGFQTHARHANGILDALFVVHRELLGDDMQDFLSRLHHQFVHVFNQCLDVRLVDLCLQILSSDEAAVLETFDVLTCDADIDQSDLGSHFLLSFLYGLLNGGHRAVDVGHDASRHAHRFTSAVAEQLNFAKLIFLTNEAGNLCGSDVEPDDDFFRVVGELVVHHG